MSNYTIDNLIPTTTGNGRIPAIKIGGQVFPMHVYGNSGYFYKCASVDTASQTWTGYRALLTNDVYSFMPTVTTGLTYGGGFTPQVGGIYTDGALVSISKLYSGWEPPAGAVFYAPLDAAAAAAETGQAFTITGNPVYAPYLGIPCAQFFGSDVIEAANTNIPYSENPLSISLWLNVASNPSGDSGIVTIGSNNASGAMLAILCNSTGISLSGHGSGYGWETMVAPATFDGSWMHVVIVFGQGFGSSRPASVYVNGVKTSGSFAYNASAYESYTPKLYLGSYWGNATHLPNLTGYLAAVRIYSRALTADEIAALAAEFTPAQE